jgi:hypothetical protein
VVRRDHLIKAKLVKELPLISVPAVPSSPTLLPPLKQESLFARLLKLLFRQHRPIAETERHCLYEECFNGDGAVVSYLNNVRRTKETTMKLCHEAVDVADRGWTRKFVQEPPDHKDVAVPDDFSVVLGFTQMLSGGGSEDEVSRLASDHGWLDASGQLTAAGDQLARALLQQSGTRTIFRVW